MKVTFTGTAALQAALERLARDVPQAVADALRAEAELEMTEAKERTPVDLGNLQGSGHVSEPVIAGNVISVELAFGGPAAPYAVHVHENLEADHPVGRAKFLESTVMEAAPHMAERVGARVARTLGLTP